MKNKIARALCQFLCSQHVVWYARWFSWMPTSNLFRWAVLTDMKNWKVTSVSGGSIMIRQ